MSGQASPNNRMKPRRCALLAAVLVLLLGLGIAAVRLWQGRFRSSTLPSQPPSTEPADPRLAYNGPYRNVHPDVRYVGDSQCAGACHAHDDIARSYAHHPMGRSLQPIESLLDRQRYTPDTNIPFTVLDRRFEVVRRGNRLWHRQSALPLTQPSPPPGGEGWVGGAIELAQEVRWAIGSGAKGYSYLTERDGYVFQTPISWFTHKQRWDLSPGFGPEVLAGRLVSSSCLYCHANRLQEHPERPDRFASPVVLQAIGCERCHGPGERHVRTGDRWDIVNPARLTPQLRDGVCEQCHLEGEARILRAGRQLFDYRPGLPLHDFWAVLVQGRQSGEDAKAVNHVEQMYQSKCFSRPVGGVKLGCITCHDPHVHVGPAQRQTYYRAKCLICHAEPSRDRKEAEAPGCSEPLPRRKEISPEDSCIDCHVPRYRSSDIPHTASSDHRIVRRPAQQPVRAADLETAVLVDFYRDRFPEGDPQTERTLGLGLVKMIDAHVLQLQPHGDRALWFLERALGRDPSDVVVREGKVEAYLLLHRPAEALGEAEVILPEQRGNWRLLAESALAAEAIGQLDQARDYWRQAVAINPFMPEYQARLVPLLMKAGRRDEARKYCEQLLRLDPFNAAGRQAWKELNHETRESHEKKAKESSKR
jgi:hypothetical protein